MGRTLTESRHDHESVTTSIRTSRDPRRTAMTCRRDTTRLRRERNDRATKLGALLVGREDFTPPSTFSGAICVATHDCVAVGVLSVDDGPTRATLSSSAESSSTDLVKLGDFSIESEGLVSVRDVYNREYVAGGVEPGTVQVTVLGNDESGAERGPVRRSRRLERTTAHAAVRADSVYRSKRSETPSGAELRSASAIAPVSTNSSRCSLTSFTHSFSESQGIPVSGPAGKSLSV